MNLVRIHYSVPKIFVLLKHESSPPLNDQKIHERTIQN